MTTHTASDGRVTDVDPAGPLCVLAGVDLIELDAGDRDSCAFEQGQTHRTVVRFYEDGVDDLDDGEVPVHRDAAAAAARLPGFESVDGWRPVWILPAPDPRHSLGEALTEAFSERQLVLDDPEIGRLRYPNRTEVERMATAALAAFGLDQCGQHLPDQDLPDQHSEH